MRRHKAVTYSRCDDTGTDKMLESVDFAAAFPSTHLATTLIHTNPLQRKFLKQRLLDLEEEKHRRDEAIFQQQRTFFMTQVFDKGLNLYQMETFSESEDEEDGAGLPEDSEIDSSEARDTFPLDLKSVSTVKHRRPSSLVRSHTVGDLQTRSFENVVPIEKSQSVSNVSKSMDRRRKSRQADAGIDTITKMIGMMGGIELKGSSQVHPGKLRRESTLPPISSMRTETSYSQTDSLDMAENGSASARQSFFRNKRRSISSLRKDPNHIFPKMNRIIAFGPEDADIESNEDELPQLKHDKKKKGGLMDDEKKNDDSASLKDSGQLDIKLIQRLSNYLPDQLVARAEDQIKQMSNSEEINATKERLLAQNRAKLDADVRKDTRWVKLNERLCPTRGMGLKWKKVPHVSKWIIN